MKLLFLGDVVGRSGRDAIARHLPDLIPTLAPDCIIVNGENAASGFGITERIAQDFFALGVHCVTTGNHAWDQRDIIPYMERESRLIRPINYPEGTPGHGLALVETRPNGPKVLVVNAMARLFMDALDDPFASMERLLRSYRLGAGGLGAIVLDFHGEASSEKMAMAHYLDGRVSLVVGTHTHIPTADTQILTGGTAYQTDTGMCGDYDSVIGMKKAAAVARFVRKMPGERLSPAEGEGTVCGVFVQTDDRTGLARSCEPVRLGGRLKPQLPG